MEDPIFPASRDVVNGNEKVEELKEEDEEDDISRPGSPYQSRSYVSATAEVDMAIQEWYKDDLVYYNDQVYKVIQVTRSKNRPTYICTIQVDGGSEIKKIAQEKLDEKSIGRNNPRYSD